jgi:hypothetical protein
MSKFWFFERKGRPTHNEKRICDTINDLINKGELSAKQVEEYISDYGKPMGESELEELYGFLTGSYTDGNKYEYSDSEGDEDDEDYEVEYEDEDEEVDDFTGDSSSDDAGKKNAVDFNPFEEPVIERSYTRGFQPKESNSDDELDSDDDESDSEDYDDDEDSDDVKFSSEDVKMPKDGESIVDDDEDLDIPEPEWASTGGFSGSSDDDEDDEDYDDDEDDEDSEKLGGDNLQDLTPAQKRKSAEKTAEALLNMYCQFVPMPFKRWSSINEGKVQKLVFENKIDLSMQLENNVSVKDYIDGTNEQVEEIFKVSDETREEIKDPLVDVLLEQDLALTPTQRLMLAVGGHLVTMGFSAFQLAQNNKQALETFEKFHIQMNKQKAPVYQETIQNKKAKPRQRRQDVSEFEKEYVDEMMKIMDDDYEPSDEDVIDAENDPNIEVTEDYGDDD